MKSLLLYPLSLILLLAPFAQAQQIGEIRRVLAQHIAAEERAETVLVAGALVYDEADPSILYIGDGTTPGGIRVSPPTGGWDHSATKDILLNGNRLQLGSGFSLIALGSYSALSGDGELQDAPGVSQWTANAVPLIRLTAGELLTSITSFTWHAADGDNGQFQLIINVGASTVVPTIQGATNLITADWTDIVPASMSEPADGLRTARIDYDGTSTLLFFRAVFPGQSPEIDLLANTTITGSLTVTGTIPRADDIDDGVTAHSWGNHATAGYLTVQQHASITTVAVDANTAITPVMDGDVFVTTHSGNFTLTLNDPAAPTRAIRVVIETRQDATGGRTVTWAGNLSTPGAVVPPALTSTANAIDVWTWQWTGSRWRLVGITFAQGNL